MAFIRRALSSRELRIHLLLFVVLGVGLAVLDWAQGRDGTTSVLGLDWAYFVIFLWSPILLIHAVVSWFGGKYVDSMDRRTLGKLYGSWFTGGHKE
ncbi:MAG: 2TM domain-containing protein [Acidimicrobiia bacterium]|nr:2TM domain-containing protein [Acidimicrobiia bacterium]